MYACVLGTYSQYVMFGFHFCIRLFSNYQITETSEIEHKLQPSVYLHGREKQIRSNTVQPL